ncbi:Dirigent protein [Dillenia turbinata]|uniref:Dirigent protein n=1 Tax=Dillenia turbinata TaxID=194707 RepID=A0AAN8ZCI5_9MAGN
MVSKIPTILLIFFMLLSFSFASPNKGKQYKPCKELVLYFHDIIYNGENAANATSAIVGSPEWANRSLLADLDHFGDVVVFDNPITLDNNLHSNPVGKAQGLYLYDRKDVFTACLDPLMEKTRDVSVAGGTGNFFMHRGVANLMTDSFEGAALRDEKVSQVTTPNCENIMFDVPKRHSSGYMPSSTL